MGNGLEIRIPSTNGLGGPNPGLGPVFLGSRFSPGAQMTIGNFIAETRVEGAFTNGGRSPLGINFSDSAPSGSLSKDSPWALWVHEKRGPQDTLRANFGIRGLTVGGKIKNWQIRVGVHRFDTVEADNLCMAESFGSQCKFAFLGFPLGWAGGEIRYDRRQETESLRRLYFRGAAMHVGYGGAFGVAEGLVQFALGSALRAPTLLATAYAALQSNPPTEDSSSRPGLTRGAGATIQFDAKGVSLGAGISYQHGESGEEEIPQEEHRRLTQTTYLNGRVKNFILHGALTYASRSDNNNIGHASSTEQSELHLEASVAYQPVKGLSLVAGYRGILVGEAPSHMAFLGINTDLRFQIPFRKKKK